MAKKDFSVDIGRILLERQINESFKPKLISRMGVLFENILMFIIILLAIIFRPINLIIGGIIAIIILLII